MINFLKYLKRSSPEVKLTEDARHCAKAEHSVTKKHVDDKFEALLATMDATLIVMKETPLLTPPADDNEK